MSSSNSHVTSPVLESHNTLLKLIVFPLSYLILRSSILTHCTST